VLCCNEGSGIQTVVDSRQDVLIIILTATALTADCTHAAQQHIRSLVRRTLTQSTLRQYSYNDRYTISIVSAVLML